MGSTSDPRTFKGGCKGAIVRLALEDFMTFRKVEFHAGPNVNLIMGPNGTGKSTIVCAICLGLAGSLKVLERAKSIKEFIRHDAYKAVIEIELYNPNGDNFVIKRVIKIKENQIGAKPDSLWFLNNNRCQQTSIKSLMNELNIQLDNLCQFLPQDRVQEFAKMDSSELLRSTEKAIGNDTLADHHDKLIQIKDQIKNIENTLTISRDNLRTEEQRNQKIAHDVSTYKETEDIKNQIQILLGKQAWMKYSKALDEFSDKKKEMDRIVTAKAAEEKIIAPLKKACDDLDQKLIKMRQGINKTRTENASQMNALKRKSEEDVNKVEIKINEIRTDLDVKIQNEENRTKHFKSWTLKLKALENEKEEMRARGDLDGVKLKGQLKELEQKQTKVSTEIIRIADQDQTDDIEISRIRLKSRSAEVNLKQLENMRGSRMKYLERNFKDLFIAVNYFQDPENRKKLHGELHEPLILSAYVNDLKYGKIVERYIGIADMTAFFFEDKRDSKVLIDVCEELGGIRFSRFHHVAPKNFNRPKSTITQDTMKKYHFQKILMNLIECDDYYMSYLVENFRVHEVPIGNSKTESLISDIMNNTNVKSVFTEEKSFTIKTSFYTKQKSSTQSDLNPASIFTDQINDIEKDKLQEIVKACQAEMNSLEKQKRDRIPQTNILKEEKNEVQAEFKRVYRKIEHTKQIDRNIEAAKETIDSYREEKIDLVALKKKTKDDIYNVRKKHFTGMEKGIEDVAKLSWKALDLVTLKRQVNLLEGRATMKHNQYDDAIANRDIYNSKIKSIKTEFEILASGAETLKKEAQIISGLKERPEQRDEVEEASIDKDINILTHRLGFLPSVENATVLEYEGRKKKIDEMSKTREQLEKELGFKKIKIVELKEGWLQPLRELVAKINSNFSKFFQSMNCAGEVVLDEAGNTDDFAKYGIKIKVKFRSNKPLSELTGWEQSGGERAITTALYVLALQELTTVPFRVIDEINQGMDAKNEARFFNLLCSLAQGVNTPQYFLLTPKMLPPLVEYPDNVDFHFILNGPHVDTNAVLAFCGMDPQNMDDDDDLTDSTMSE